MEIFINIYKYLYKYKIKNNIRKQARIEMIVEHPFVYSSSRGDTFHNISSWMSLFLSSELREVVKHKSYRAVC